MSERALADLKALKDCREGDRVTFRARVLRLWEVGGRRMCLVGDESALSRVDIGQASLGDGGSYEFQNLTVREYPGGWHSASFSEESRAVPLDFEVAVSRDEAYIERTYKILSGVQRKKGRAAGRIPPWRHPAAADRSEGYRSLFVSDVDADLLHQFGCDFDDAVFPCVLFCVPEELIFGLAAHDMIAASAGVYLSAFDYLAHSGILPP